MNNLDDCMDCLLKVIDLVNTGNPDHKDKIRDLIKEFIIKSRSVE